MRREISSYKLPRWPRWARKSAWTVVLFSGIYGGCNILYTGWPVPIIHIQRLDKPVSVAGWSEVGLNLADGRTVMPKGMIKLPETSATIEAACRQGIEVAPDGRVFGLIKYHHWCGNDPVRYDLRRVDIAHLLAFHKEGKSEVKPGWYADAPFKEGRHGWARYTKFEMAFDPRMKDYFDSREKALAQAGPNSRP